MARSVVTSSSLEETKAFGKKLAKTLKPGSILACFGDLGSGKTACIKSIASTLTALHEDEINSPTFNYVNDYDGVYHFDLYRLKNFREFLQKGFDEYLTSGSICLIEWAERIEEHLPASAIKLRFKFVDEKTRTMSIES